MIRVPIPIDLGTVAATASGAFALATPIRIDRLIELAVCEAIGARSPRDKRERSVRKALGDFARGAFVVDVDGRLFDRGDATVVCAGVATLRFFLTEERRSRALPSR